MADLFFCFFALFPLLVMIVCIGLFISSLVNNISAIIIAALTMLAMQKPRNAPEEPKIGQT